LLFTNRYKGENEETKHEKNHLSELLKRIEKQKQERANKNNIETQEDNLQSLKKKKKKKKKEINEQSDFNISEHTTKDSNQHLKKKRRKTEDICNENSDINYKPESKDVIEDKRLQNETIDNQQHKISNNKPIGSNETNQQINFMVLGAKNKKKKQEIKRVLPEWLANPEVISINLDSGPNLEEFNSIIDSKLIETLRANGINKLFPVQSSMISWLLKCDKDRQQGWWLRDTCVSAPTGSGKTLAYVLPIVQILQSRLVPKIRCLIVVPVQELATQVYKVMLTYTARMNLKVGLLSGASVFQQEQSNILKKNARGEYVSSVDIIVATPGRLVDHILKTPGFSLDDLRFLVIDEADKAADWLEYLPEPHYRSPQLTLFNLRCSKVPAQKLLFSATLSQDPEKLNRLGLLQPILFTSVLVTDKDDNVNLDNEVGNFVGRYISPEELVEQAVECAAEYKPVALYQLLIRNNTINKTLIFTNSGKTAHRLTILLQSLLSKENIAIGELSAQLVSKEREDILKKFISGKVQILITSDALARGVDIPDVQLVVSYDLPKHIKGYIHRVGRTGRAGKSGTAISILTPKQSGIFKHMLSSVHKKIPDIEKMELDSLINEIDYSNHIEQLKHILEVEKQNNLLRIRSVKHIKSVIME
ncbi:putative ATP-dependent RNA helicase Dbp73D, partial [Xylocopa sonorina]|uniref:putative ATP-dependent RNA helicase Dbp73D n=1 Tax=Xylocopa sonorina TaxID=1818115 RepID=UPI00403ABB10